MPSSREEARKAHRLQDQAEHDKKGGLLTPPVVLNLVVLTAAAVDGSMATVIMAVLVTGVTGKAWLVVLLF